MDLVMEVALLQRRFPDVPVKDCGKLVKGTFVVWSVESVQVYFTKPRHAYFVFILTKAVVV